MYLRKIFQEFLVLHTDADPAVSDDVRPTHPWPAANPRSLPPPRTEAFDWRWLETIEDAP